MLNFWYNGEQIFYLRRSVRGNGAINVIEFGGFNFSSINCYRDRGHIYIEGGEMLFLCQHSHYISMSLCTHITHWPTAILPLANMQLLKGAGEKAGHWHYGIIIINTVKSRSGLSVPPLWPCGLVSECRGRILYSLHLVSGQPASSPDLSVIITSLMSPVTLRGIL